MNYLTKKQVIEYLNACGYWTNEQVKKLGIKNTEKTPVDLPNKKQVLVISRPLPNQSTYIKKTELKGTYGDTLYSIENK